jgi:hypothetical protein
MIVIVSGGGVGDVLVDAVFLDDLVIVRRNGDLCMRLNGAETQR